LPGGRFAHAVKTPDGAEPPLVEPVPVKPPRPERLAERPGRGPLGLWGRRNRPPELIDGVSSTPWCSGGSYRLPGHGDLLGPGIGPLVDPADIFTLVPAVRCNPAEEEPCGQEPHTYALVHYDGASRVAARGYPCVGG
jgi:hypothetical protein